MIKREELVQTVDLFGATATALNAIMECYEGKLVCICPP